MIRLLSTCAVAMLLSPSSVSAQPVSPEQIRDAVSVAVAKAGADERRFRSAFQEAIRAHVRDYENAPAWLDLGADGLAAVAFGPAQWVAHQTSERVRRMEPVTDVAVPAGYIVLVEVGSIAAPDIVRVVVQRGEEVVQASRTDSFTPADLQTAMGVTVRRHQGFVEFPASAFAPGRDINVVLIPQSGQNLSARVRDSKLKKMR